jgi:hypothetical protein
VRADHYASFLFYDNAGVDRAAGVEAEADARWPHGMQGGSVTHGGGHECRQKLRLSNSPAHIGQLLFSTPVGGRMTAASDVPRSRAGSMRSGEIAAARVVPSATLSAPLFSRRLQFTLHVSDFHGHNVSPPCGWRVRAAAGRTAGTRRALTLDWRF